VTLNLAGGTYASISAGGAYRMELYSSHGRRLASLGVTSQPPLVSGTHVITVNDDAATNVQTIAERTLPNGRVRDVIAFNAPGRALVTVAFSWPRLAVIETTSPALPDGQFSCQYGTYGPPTKPFLAELDLARHTRVDPAPIPPPQPTSQQIIARCGPLPP
jgi:hypothetical protein